MVGEQKRGEKGSDGAADVIPTLFLLLHPNSKYLKIETRSVLEMKR